MDDLEAVRRGDPEARERWVAAWNAHDADALVSFCTDDILWEDPASPEPQTHPFRSPSPTLVDAAPVEDQLHPPCPSPRQ